MPVSAMTRALALAPFALLLLALPSGLLQVFEGWEAAFRVSWRRPRTALAIRARASYPRVCVHVPASAEPAEVVIETLDALSRVTYANFEVLVIDNNTKDQALWRPVEAHCRTLGERFRFVHVEDMPGAKAGALNYALTLTSPDVELVSIVDSDYVVEPDFLDRLVGHFDDPQIGFVQTPHSYRGWQDTLYLKMCNWEYQYFFSTILPSRNEREAALIVGTMCLIRRAAIDQAGGWAHWCVTEDSELAVRIHALGYSSVYINETVGRGLIPETFAGYKQQRFRWTYGPVQELKHHVRLFLPGRLAQPSRLSVAQKIHHLNHGLDRLAIGLVFLTAPLTAATALSMLAHDEIISVPSAFFVCAPLGLATGIALRWLIYCRIIGCSLSEAIGAIIASRALTHTVRIASIRGLLTRSIPWRRTNKFKPRSDTMRAMLSARTELTIVLVIWAAIAATLSTGRFGGVVLVVIVGAALQSLSYLCSPLLALLAERDLRAREQHQHIAGAPIQPVETAWAET